MVRPFSPVWHPLVCESWLCPECVHSGVECTFLWKTALWFYNIAPNCQSLEGVVKSLDLSLTFCGVCDLPLTNSEGVDLVENMLKMKCQSTQSSPLNFLTLTRLQLTWMWVTLHTYVHTYMYREERETLIANISIYPSPSWCQSTLEVWMCSPREEEETSLHRLHHMSCLSCPTWHAQQSQPETVVDTCRVHYKGTQFQKNCMALQGSMIGRILSATNTSVMMEQWQKLGLIINTALLSISFCAQTDALCRSSISLRIAPFSLSNSTWDETPSSQRLHPCLCYGSSLPQWPNGCDASALRYTCFGGEMLPFAKYSLCKSTNCFINGWATFPLLLMFKSAPRWDF